MDQRSREDQEYVRAIRVAHDLDFSEYAPLSDTTGGFLQSVDWVFKVCRHLQSSVQAPCSGTSVLGSATSCEVADIDIVVTDPPYYDAIPYSDLMDFFHVWLRRSLYGVSDEIDSAFSVLLAPSGITSPTTVS